MIMSMRVLLTSFDGQERLRVSSIVEECVWDFWSVCESVWVFGV